MEPLTLALLALPGDPGDFTGPILEHPEVLLAKGRAGGGGKVAVKVFIKLLRALRKRRLSELHELYPEWWGVWRYGSAAPYWKVRLYCQTVYPPLLASFAAPFLRGVNPPHAVPARRRRGGLGVRVWNVAYRRRHWGPP